MWNTSDPKRGWVRWSWSVSNTAQRPQLPLELAEIPGVTVRDVSPTTGFVEVHNSARRIIRSVWQGAPDPRALTPQPFDADIIAEIDARRPLFAHQKSAIEFALATASGCVIADEMGLGKTTAAAIIALARARGRVGRHERHEPVMIVGPQFVRDVWRRELYALGAIENDTDFVALEGVGARDDSFARAPFWFCHYEILDAWRPRIWFNHAARRPGVVIFDEAHRVKNPNTISAKASLRVAGVTPFRLVLTGTPMPNGPADLYMLLALVDGEQAWGKYYGFRKRYCGAVQGDYGMHDTGPSREAEFQLRISDRYISRTKAEVGLNLPPLTRGVHRVDATADLRAAQALTLARSGCSMAQLVDAIRSGRGGERVFEVLHALRRMSSEAKFRTTKELVSSCLEQRQSVLVFTQERKMAERFARGPRLNEAAYDSGDVKFIHGGLAQNERDEIVAGFQKYGRERPLVLAATYGALREGVTLTAAQHVVLHDLDWTPSTIFQAEARPHRFGTTGVQVHWMVLRDSIDTLFAEALGRKVLEGATLLDDTSARAMKSSLESLELERTTGVRTVADEVAQLFAAWG